jgi:GTP-binding protein
MVHFRREKYVPRGGPDGGDGGRGGDVVLEVTPTLNTLSAFQHKHKFRAADGGNGAKQNQTGRSADDLVIPVPPGTVVYLAGSNELLGDLVEPGLRFVIAKGGRGGRGNSHFATATRHVPMIGEKGEPGEERTVRLELKLIADIGIVGVPNAGKSTLLASVTRARPKIASYPFTTLEPNLGVVSAGPGRSFVMADIPGIIEGAHAGKGLGLQFLRHVERTRILAYLISLEAEDPQAVYDRLRREVRLHSAVLDRRPHLVVLSKRDILPPDAAMPPLSAPDALAVLVISSVSRAGLEPLVEALWQHISAEREGEQARVEQEPYADLE